ncbi:MAG: hypothetical protein IAF00_05420 [Phycisphaerales bacterium]|nr:hypothetical protein [Phycisphaerales bacterium]
MLAIALAGCADNDTLHATARPTTDLSLSSGTLSQKAKREQQLAILKIRDQTLDQLFKLNPSARTEFDQAAGYGVFDINGLNAVLVEAHGRGVVLDKKNRAAYMQLTRTDIDLGAELKPYRQVLIFNDPATLSRFIASGSSPTNASSDSNITIYRLDITGVSTQVDWAARYFRDPDLN